MQFSIFGVPFKCTKDMFTWEKVKWSIFVYWAQLWRGGIFSVVAMVVAFAILLAPAVLNPEALAQYANSELALKIIMHIAYSLHYWYQQMFALGIVLLCLWFVGLILGGGYIQYYSMFKKNYRSFSRQFNKPEVKSFWSGGFWKPVIFTMAFGLLMGVIIGALFGLLDIQQGVVALINLIIGVILFHIFLQGGTWGFVPVRKQTKIEGSEVKS